MYSPTTPSPFLITDDDSTEGKSFDDSHVPYQDLSSKESHFIKSVEKDMDRRLEGIVIDYSTIGKEILCLDSRRNRGESSVLSVSGGVNVS